MRNAEMLARFEDYELDEALFERVKADSADGPTKVLELLLYLTKTTSRRAKQELFERVWAGEPSAMARSVKPSAGTQAAGRLTGRQRHVRTGARAGLPIRGRSSSCGPVGR